MNENITTIIDVGVWKGTPDLYERYYNSKEIHLIDPLNCEKNFVHSKHSEGKKLFFYECAVGKESGQLTLNCTGNLDDMASLCQRTPLTLGARKEKQRLVDVKRLDDLFTTVDPNTVLKLDTEGFELEALQGATNLIKQITYVECEVTNSGVERFEDSYKYSELMEFMSLHNYKKESEFPILNKNIRERVSNLRFERVR